MKITTYTKKGDPTKAIFVELKNDECYDPNPGSNYFFIGACNGVVIESYGCEEWFTYSINDPVFKQRKMHYVDNGFHSEIEEF